MKENVLTAPVELTMVSGPAAPMPVLAELRYDTSDPYALSALFDVGEPEPVSWVFSRDLLDEGVVHPVGDGDIKVEPVVDGLGERCVRLHLSSPDGAAVLDISIDAVLTFLESTYEVVPPGREDSFLDLDATVAALLAS